MIVKMRGSNAFASQARKSAAELEAMGVKGSRALSSIAIAGQKLQAFGATMTKSVTLPIAALGGYAIKSSIDFHRSMELISTQAGATQGEVDKLTNSVLSMAASGKFEQGPMDLAKALFHVESAGFRGAKAMDVLRSSANLAAVGQSDLESTTNALVAAQKTGIAGAGNLKHAIGTLNATVGAGNLRMDDLVSAMGTGFLGSAKQMGISLKEMGAALAELTKQGLPAASAATKLRMTFTSMATIQTRASAAKALHGIGLSANELSNVLRNQGLLPALQLLHDHLQQLSKAQQTNVLASAFGGSKSGGTIMQLLKNLKDLGTTQDAIGKSTGNFNDKLKETRDLAEFQLQTALAQAQAALIRFGDVLGPIVLPALGHLVNTLSDAAGWFNKLPGPVKNLAGQMLLLLAAVGPLFYILGALARGPFALLAASKGLIIFIQALTATMGALDVGAITAASAMLGFDIALLAIPLAIAAVAAGLVILYLKVKWFRDKVNAVINFFKDHPFAAMLIPGIGPFVTETILIIKNFGRIKQAAIDTFGWIKNAAGNIGGWFSGAWHAVTNGLQTAFNAVKTGITDALNFIIDRINNLIDAFNALPGPDIGNVARIGETPHKVQSGLSKGLAHAAGLGFNLSHRLQHRAMGGPILPGGTALVGERGPELASFPYGANIDDANKTAGLLSRSHDNLPPIVIPVYLDGRKVAESVVKAGQTAKARK